MQTSPDWPLSIWTICKPAFAAFMCIRSSRHETNNSTMTRISSAKIIIFYAINPSYKIHLSLADVLSPAAYVHITL